MESWSVPSILWDAGYDPLTQSSLLWARARGAVHSHSFIIMTAGVLAFLRPLYDIAVWQFILMGGCSKEEKGPGKMTLSFAAQELIAGLMCKLLEAEAFKLLRQKVETVEGSVIGNWKVGEKPTKKLVEWCQDQWRRKQPDLPAGPCRYAIGKPLCVPLFGKAMPLCHRCGTPCPDCCVELGHCIPAELSSAYAVLEVSNGDSEDKENMDQNDDDQFPATPSPPSRMKLRSGNM